MNPAVLPNVLTVARILAVAPLIVCLLTGRYSLALALAVFAGITDALDGWLARRFGWQSRFGGFADPLADKLLLVGAYVTLAWLGELPWWLIVIVALRDLIIVIGGTVYHFRFERVTAEPTQWSRFNTFCQVLLMWYVLFRLAGVPLPTLPEHALIALVAVMTGLTLIQYVLVWSLRARRIARDRRT